MTDTTNPTQPTDGAPQNPSVLTPSAPPTGTGVLSAAEVETLREKLALTERQLASVRGNYDQEKQRADRLAGENNRLTSTYEAERSTLTTTATNAQAELQQKNEELERERVARRIAENRLGLSAQVFDPTKYPALSGLTPTLRKAVLNEAAGYEGDALTAFLAEANAEAEANAAAVRRDHRAGGVPPQAPASGTAGAELPSDFASVRQAMNEALKTKGIRSPEYKELKVQYDQLIRERKAPPLPKM